MHLFFSFTTASKDSFDGTEIVWHKRLDLSDRKHTLKSSSDLEDYRTYDCYENDEKNNTGWVHTRTSNLT